MNPDTISSWRLDFARSAEFRREQDRFFKEVERRQKEARDDARSDDDLSEFATAALLASETEIAAFRMELDDYRTATTEALMENERQLAIVQAELDHMLARAYVLPDGRRVFKTEDGLRVFDEHGVELGADDIDPDLIENWRPRAEGYLDRRDAKIDLLRQHDELLTFEERIELADDRAKSGEMTKEEMKAFRADLEVTAPASVRRKLPGYEEKAALDPTRDFGAAASLTPDLADLKLDMPEFSR